MRTVLADDFVSELASEVVLNSLLLGRSLDGSLKSIKEHGQVLLDVHLLIHVDRLAFPVFKSVAVALGVDVHFLREK